MSRLSALLALPPVVLGVAAAAYLISAAPGPAQEENARPGQAVRVATVEARDIAPVVRGWGSVRAANTWAAVSEVRGQVVWRHPDLDVGKLISAGTEVLKIDPSDYQLAIAQGEADLASLAAEAGQIEAERDNTRRVLDLEAERLRLAEADLERVRNLVAQGVSPKTRADEVEKAALQSRRTVAELQNALDLIAPRLARLAAQEARTQASVARARRDLDHTALVAPFDLRVGAVNAELYQSVSLGQLLIEGNGIDSAEVVVQVPLPAFQRLLGSFDANTDTLAAIDAGPSRRISASLHLLIDPSQSWPATVSRVEGALDPRARTVPVVVTVENPYSGANPPARMPLVPNMQVEVALTGAPVTDAIVAPEAALHGESLYLVTKDSRLELRAVVPAFRQDGLVVLREGAAAGEQVVLDAIAPALPGMALQPVAVDGGAQ